MMQGAQPLNQNMRTRIADGHGFIAALDQSGGSTRFALAQYGIDAGAWRNDEEMFALIHQMRVRLITAPVFTGDKVIGAILFERTMDGQAGGKPVPAALLDRGVIPFLKIDQGLEQEVNGVQLLKPMPGLDLLLFRAREMGVFGTKARSVINVPDRKGIAAIVRQQFQVGAQVLAAGLMPILETEVTISNPGRAQSDNILLEELTEALDALPGDGEVMLKLSLPANAGRFGPLVSHARVLKVVALSGGYKRSEANVELAKNPGIIASFSRALLEDLRFEMSDAEFNTALGDAIEEIYVASTHKEPDAV